MEILTHGAGAGNIFYRSFSSVHKYFLCASQQIIDILPWRSDISLVPSSSSWANTNSFSAIILVLILWKTPELNTSSYHWCVDNAVGNACSEACVTEFAKVCFLVSTEAYLTDDPELFDQGTFPSITTSPWIHINTRNREQALMDSFKL